MAVVCKGDRANKQEDKERSEHHVPTWQVTVVQQICVPTGKEIVHDREGQRSANGVICADITQNCELGGGFHVGTKETTEKRGEGSAPNPLVHWMKDLLVLVAFIQGAVEK